MSCDKESEVAKEFLKAHDESRRDDFQTLLHPQAIYTAHALNYANLSNLFRLKELDIADECYKW
ncbi:3206_t:CDS:2 [Funneliformis geosporum]|uniref:3206_t:CDS:1 n=1 Tax=Funneliformis geosporum TaxID=1117311 RepID=A0A9W4WNX9_9GLOM|nr:3206_t:CDS:2 [Funneliformis geosporum]